MIVGSNPSKMLQGNSPKATLGRIMVSSPNFRSILCLILGRNSTKILIFTFLTEVSILKYFVILLQIIIKALPNFICSFYKLTSFYLVFLLQIMELGLDLIQLNLEISGLGFPFLWNQLFKLGLGTWQTYYIIT